MARVTLGVELSRPCPHRNLASDDDVFFETVQVVNATAGSGVNQHPSRVLERSGRQEAVAPDGDLRNTKQQLRELNWRFALAC